MTTTKKQTAAELVIPAPTQWIDPKKQPPDADTMLLIRGTLVPEAAAVVDGDPIVIALGYKSSKTGVYIGIPSGVCLDESVEVLGYHTVTRSDMRPILMNDYS